MRPPEGQPPATVAIPDMRELLRQMYRTFQHGPAPACRDPARRFREHVAPLSGSQDLLFLEEDCDRLLVARHHHKMAMVSHAIVESVNQLLKVRYNDHSARSGARKEVGNPTVREATVVARVWEWWWLQFDIPLTVRGVPHRTPCPGGGGGATETGPDATPPLAICHTLRGGRGGGRGVGWRVGGGGVLAAWRGGRLHATHYYHMHTSRGVLRAWGYRSMCAIIAISCLCQEESLKGLKD